MNTAHFLPVIGLVACAATPAYGQSSDPIPAAGTPTAVVVSGSAALTSDYRFRGISQTDKGMAVWDRLNASYADAAITYNRTRYRRPSFSMKQNGFGSADGTIGVPLTASF